MRVNIIWGWYSQLQAPFLIITSNPYICRRSVFGGGQFLIYVLQLFFFTVILKTTLDTEPGCRQNNTGRTQKTNTNVCAWSINTVAGLRTEVEASILLTQFWSEKMALSLDVECRCERLGYPRHSQRISRPNGSGSHAWAHILNAIRGLWGLLQWEECAA